MASEDHHSLSVRTKRKPSRAAASDIPSSKRRRRQAPLPVPAFGTVLERRRATAFKGSTTASSLGLARTSSNAPPSASKAPPVTGKSFDLFSRYADPSVHSPQPRPVDSDVSYVSKDKAPDVPRLETPPYRRLWSHDHEPRAVRLTSQGVIDGVVDLTLVEHVATLDMVEGDDILQTLLRASTPRIQRRFPSEKALTEKEQRDRDVLRRRRLKLRSQFSGRTEEQARDDGRGVGALLQSPDIETCLLFKPAERGSGNDEGETGEGADDDERAQLMEEEAQTDEELTDSKINRVSEAMHMNWRNLFLWLMAGAMLLCVIVVAGPVVKNMMEAPLPYCDSEWIEVDEGSYGLADNFDRSKALQPFITTASAATRASEPVCQACPVYGNCLNGSVISCAPPYKLQYGLCEETPEAQANLDQLAFSIETFIVEKASKNACDSVSLWSYLSSENGVEPMSDVPPP